MATKNEQDAVEAAQPQDGSLPLPAWVQSHTWIPDPSAEGYDPEHSEDTSPGYQAQMAMPVHLVVADRKLIQYVDAPGTPEHDKPVFLTTCGIQVGSEMLRTTDDIDNVTCEQCQSAGSPSGE